MTADIRTCTTCLTDFVCTAAGEADCERCERAYVAAQQLKIHHPEEYQQMMNFEWVGA